MAGKINERDKCGDDLTYTVPFLYSSVIDVQRFVVGNRFIEFAQKKGKIIMMMFIISKV